MKDKKFENIDKDKDKLDTDLPFTFKSGLQGVADRSINSKSACDI